MRSPTPSAAELWCLGDLVGYGADPDACVDLAREHAAICLAGNHDLGVTGAIAARAVLPRRRAGRDLDPGDDHPGDPRATWSALDPSNLDEAVGLYHASPRDPVWEYVLSPLQAELCLDVQAAAHRPDRPLPRRAVVLAVPGAPATGETRDRRDQLDLIDRRMADQPRQRRPAARRRSARGLAGARPRRLASACIAASNTTSPARRRPSGPPGCPIRWPSGSCTASEPA